MRLDERAKGVFIIAVTPFREDGALDLASLDRLTDFYLERRVDGITLLGMMGEASKLTAEESREVVAAVARRVDGRVPIVVGCSAPGLAPMRELAEAAMDLGAAGVMIAPAAGLRTDDQVLGYFQSVADTLGDTPWVLQDFPLSTGVQIAPSVIARIVETVPSCVMLKHEDWPGLAKITALRSRMEAGLRRISILVGNGGIFLPEEMGRGADGAMTGFAFPEMLVGVVAAFASGDVERARDLFDAYLPLARYEQQPGLGLAVRKYLLARRGAIACAALRRPGATLSQADTAEIERLLARQERRLAALGAAP